MARALHLPNPFVSPLRRAARRIGPGTPGITRAKAPSRAVTTETRSSQARRQNECWPSPHGAGVPGGCGTGSRRLQPPWPPHPSPLGALRASLWPRRAAPFGTGTVRCAWGMSRTSFAACREYFSSLENALAVLFPTERVILVYTSFGLNNNNLKAELA